LETPHQTIRSGSGKERFQKDHAHNTAAGRERYSPFSRLKLADRLFDEKAGSPQRRELRGSDDRE
jgi:hypothetical protein